jgi:hypothetical protein
MAGNSSSGDAPTEPFIGKWLGQENGQEAANCTLFLTELRAGLGLPQAAGPLDANAVAARFKQGRHIAAKVAAVARTGFVDSADGERTFLFRRAA